MADSYSKEDDEDKELVYSKEYRSVDIGVLISFIGGALSCLWVDFFMNDRILLGILFMIFSLSTLLIGRFIALRSVFERDNEGE